MKYDAIVLLGSQPDPQSWKFPDQIYQCIERTAQLLSQDAAPFVIACGKWTIDFDFNDYQQPFDECDELAKELISLGIDNQRILREHKSKDSISNLYYIKQDFLIPQQMTNILFVVASFRVKRLKFLVEKIWGNGYNVEYDQIPSEPGPSYNEADTMARQTKFLTPMPDGDHSWLNSKFYSDPFYIPKA